MTSPTDSRLNPKAISLKSIRHRHCERSEAIQGPAPMPFDFWIASSPSQ